MAMNHREICERLKDENAAIAFLQEKGMLHQERRCAHGHPMKLSLEKNGIPARWRCQTAGCRTQVSLRRSTRFDGYKLDLRTAVLLIYSWNRERTTSKFCSEELGISRKTAVEWKQSLRQVLAESLAQNPLVIGGPGLTVEVDETAFSKRKYGRGRLYPQQQRVFGGACRETGECFLVPVVDHSSQTLMPLIRRYIRTGTAVVTDCWGASVQRGGYTHLTVNHSRNFVHPVTGAHTQTVESLWALLKRPNKLRCGTRRSPLHSYLEEFMWCRRLRPQEDPSEKSCRR